jgi:hypothetical protein
MKYFDIQMKSSIVNFTDDQLEKFRQNPSINPKTGRKIKMNGKVFQLLNKELQKKDEIDLSKDINIKPKLIVKKFRAKEL